MRTWENDQMNSTKIAEKRKKRQQKVAVKRKYQDQVRRASRYPLFVFEPNDAPPAFVAAVQEAVATINFDDRAVYAGWERQVYQEIRRVGWPSAGTVFAALEKAGHPQATAALVAFLGHLGQEVFRRIPEAVLLQHIPINDVQFLPDGKAIRVIFRSLRRDKGQYGTLYYSRHKPTVLVNGEQKVVAFSIHAIQRICDRVYPRWRNYLGLGDAFALFDQCLEFEVCNLHGGQVGFTFFENCAKGFWNEAVAREVLCNDFHEDQGYAVRIGYCPAQVEGEFIKAKTFLCPGYTNTPEFTAILRSGLPYAEKQALIDQTRNRDAQTIWVSQDCSLLKWLQDHGVPQVVARRVKYASPFFQSRQS